MRLCILCDDANVADARTRSLTVLPVPEIQVNFKTALMAAKGLDNKDMNHLNIPLSSSGELPATHWFCFINANQELYDKMKANQLHTIIEEGIPSEFITKYGLKRIKSTSTEF
jgi:hypothetical protein